MNLLILLIHINPNNKVIINLIYNQQIQTRHEKKILLIQILEEIFERVKLSSSNKLDYSKQNWMRLENKYKKGSLSLNHINLDYNIDH